MIWIIIPGMLLIIIGLLFYILSSKINNYAQSASQNDLHDIGLSAKSFIGLHIKALELDHLNPKLIYVRKTTPYKGLILFLPDWQFDFHFYLPFLYWLCRKGYLLVTYTSEKEIYTQTPDEIKEIIQCINHDEVLKTYPLSVIGHGSGGYAALYGQDSLEASVKIVTLAALPPEDAALFGHIQKGLPFSIDFLRKIILWMSKRRFHCTIQRPVPEISHTILMIRGQKDPSGTAFYSQCQSDLVTIDDRERKLHHPYLNLKSDLRLQRIIERLGHPEISQYDYDKMLETFDTDMLYDLDLEIAEKIDQFITA